MKSLGVINAVYFVDYEDGTAEWFLCVDDSRWPGEPTLICVKSTYEEVTKGKVRRVGEAFSVGGTEILKPDEWPDDVCAAVAKFRLAHAD